jgi:hypothetical protein
LFPVEFVPADWGWYDCVRLATPAEMAAAGNRCADCAVLLTAKLGSGFVPGKMVGRRPGPDHAWTWPEGPLCQACDKAHAVRDGLTVDRHAAVAA